MELGSFQPDALIAGDNDIVTEDVYIPSGNNLARGTVLGRVRVSVPASGTADGSNTGDGTVTAVTGGPKTQQGTYTVECITAETNGGTFRITDPDGNDLGDAKIQAGAGNSIDFSSEEINLTITDGSTDFAVGDKFTIAVTEGVPNTGTAAGGNTGDGTLTEVEGRRDLKVGTYTIVCTAAATNSGTFKVTDPDGNDIQTGITIPAGAGNSISFENDQIAGKITDGSTDFAVNDEFTVAVSIHPRQVVAVDKTATDGSSEPYAVLLDDRDATSAAKVGAALVKGTVNERELVFASGTDIEDMRDKMRAVGIYTKGSIASTYPG